MRLAHAAGSILICAALPLFTGCSTSFSPAPEAPATHTIRAIHGVAHGGQQPISGQSIYLYANGNSGVGSSSRSVLTASVCTNSPSNCGQDGNNNYYVITDANGDFALTGDYTCSTNESLYIYGSGGNSGAGTGSNSHIGLLASLGTCASNSGDLSAQVPSIQLNEISTIATAYSLAGFAHSPTAIGSGSSTAAIQGMTNAVANVPNIYNFAVGMPLTSTASSSVNSSGTVPANKMLWLADIIAACVNTDPIDSNLTCAGLFAAMPNPGGGTPADTAQVALNMAHTQSPASNIIAGLTLLIPTQPAFPYTSTSYTDLALPVVYSIAALGEPATIAIDANGSIWIPDDRQTDQPVYELSPQGASSSFTPAGAGVTDFNRMAISPKDNSLWFFNVEGDSIVPYSNAGAYLFSPNVATGRAGDGGMAFDGNGNVFFGAGSSKFSVVEDNSSGSHVATGASTTTGGQPFMALDSNLNVWMSGTSKFFEVASPYTATPVSISNSYYNTIYTGANGLIWFPASSTAVDSYYYKSSTSSIAAGPACTGGGLISPNSVAIDGAGNLWAPNSNSNGSPQTISGFSTTASTCTALTTTSGISNGVDPTGNPTSLYIAADSSGNIWTSNYGVTADMSAYAFTFTQFLGLSVPAVTPLSPALVGTTPQ